MVNASNSERRQAIENLSIIREAINRSTGSTYFVDFFRQAGLLLLTFGLLTIGASATTHAVLSGLFVLGHTTGAVAAMWVAVLVIVGLVKVVYIGRRAHSLGLPLIGYSRAMLTRGFLHAVFPIGLGVAAFAIYFVRAGQFACLPAIMTLYAGAVFAAFGTVFLERRFAYAGHVLALLGAVGLLFMTQHVLLYLALLGALATGYGLYLMLAAHRSDAPTAGSPTEAGAA